MYTSPCKTALASPVPLPETGMYTWMSKNVISVTNKDFLLSRAKILKDFRAIECIIILKIKYISSHDFDPISIQSCSTVEREQ